MTFTAHDRQTALAIISAIKIMDAALGTPYGVGEMKDRVRAWLPACRGLPDDAITFAAEVVCEKFEKYPVPAQFRKIAQGSPAYQATIERPKPKPPPEPEPSECVHCGHTRRRHRVRLMPDMKGTISVNVIRHVESCVLYEPPPHSAWWADDDKERFHEAANTQNE